MGKKYKPVATDQNITALGARDGFNCTYCGIELIHDGNRDVSTVIIEGNWRTNAKGYGFLNVDHVIPKTRGGSNDLSNLVLCCSFCNQQKGNKTADEYAAWKARKVQS